eukprot:157536-Pelagomonas_calceolata.AAC.1
MERVHSASALGVIFSVIDAFSLYLLSSPGVAVTKGGFSKKAQQEKGTSGDGRPHLHAGLASPGSQFCGPSLINRALSAERAGEYEH